MIEVTHPVGLIGGRRGLLVTSRSISLCRPRDAAVDPLLVDVGDHHRNLEPAEEEQGQLGGHQAGPDDADLGHRSGQDRVRGAGRLLGPFLQQIEGVQARPAAPRS